MWKNPAEGFAGATGGERLERALWDEVRSGDMVRLKRRLAPNFVATTPSGRQTADAWMNSLSQQKSQTVMISDLQIESQGADAIVAYTLTRHSSDRQSAPMHALSVWQQVTKGWVLVAHSETPQ